MWKVYPTLRELCWRGDEAFGVLPVDLLNHFLGERECLQKVVQVLLVVIAAEEEAIGVTGDERDGVFGIAFEGGET